MAASPVFAATPLIALAQVTAANTNRDGTGTVVDVVTGGTNGSFINEIKVTSIGTVTAGAVRLYIYDGTNRRLFDEFLVPATTPSTTVNVWMRTAQYYNLILPANTWKIQASTHNAETFNIIALYANI